MPRPHHPPRRSLGEAIGRSVPLITTSGVMTVPLLESWLTYSSSARRVRVLGQGQQVDEIRRLVRELSASGHGCWPLLCRRRMRPLDTSLRGSIPARCLSRELCAGSEAELGEDVRDVNLRRASADE